MSSLKVIASPALREPAPLITRVRSRAGANDDGIGGSQVLQWSAGKSEEGQQLLLVPR
jgi:hypothetical protein